MKCSKCQTEYESAFCPNCGAAANPQKKTKSQKKWWILIALFFAMVVGVLGISMFSHNEIDLESTNVVEGIAEYKINRVFTTNEIEGLLRTEKYVYKADSGEAFLIIDAEVKNLKSVETKASELIVLSLTINGNETQAFAYIIDETTVEKDGTIPANETARVYYAVDVRQGEDPGNMTLKTVCGGKEASCEISLSMYEDKKESLILNNEYTDNATRSITIEKVWFTDKVEPSDYEKYDYYDYYYAEEGKTILAVKMSVKNLGSNSLYLNELTGIGCYHTQGCVSGVYCAEAVSGTRCLLEEYNDFIRDNPSVEPQETRTVYYIIQLPESVANGPVELEFYLAGETYYYQAN